MAGSRGEKVAPHPATLHPCNPHHVRLSPRTPGMLTQTFYILGEFLLVAASLALPAWRPLTAAVATAAAATLACALLVPESPRWLLLNGKPDQVRYAMCPHVLFAHVTCCTDPDCNAVRCVM